MPNRAHSFLAFSGLAAVLVAAGAWHARSSAQTRATEQHTLSVEITPISDGLRVDAVAPGGIAADVGIRAGDVLVGVDRRPVSRVDELEQRLAVERRSRELTLQVLRDGVITEAYLATSPRQRARNAAEPEANRHCATLALDRDAGVFREAGCAISRRTLCNGCSG